VQLTENLQRVFLSMRPRPWGMAQTRAPPCRILQDVSQPVTSVRQEVREGRLENMGISRWCMKRPDAPKCVPFCNAWVVRARDVMRHGRA
jgi:hypothetical protein